MPLPLGRIEREYVLQILESDRPSLSVLSGGNVFTVKSSGYTVSGETIAFSPVFDLPVQGSSVRIFFRHKKRGMYFNVDSVVCTPDSGSVLIPEDIYMEETESGGEGQGMVIVRFPSGDCSFPFSRDFPLAFALPDPDLLHSRAGAIERLAVKAGVAGAGPYLPYRLYSYIDGFRHGTGASDIVLYIDHRFVMVSVRNPRRFDPVSGQSVPLRIVHDLRTVTLVGRICGVLPVNDSVSVICLETRDVQPEDQRFLYERTWGEKYRG